MPDDERRSPPTAATEVPESDDEQNETYAEGTGRELDDPDLPLSREDEGMDR